MTDNGFCYCADCKQRRYDAKIKFRSNVEKLKAKGKRLYAFLYLPTGEYIQWSDDPNNIIVPRNYTAEALIERVNDQNANKWGATHALIERNEIVIPSIVEHYEKVEIIYDKN